MSRKIVSFDFAMSSTEGEMYTNKLSEQRVYTNDTNSVELEFNITDVAPGYLPSVGANAMLYIYMADGSFFVKYAQHLKLGQNRFYYVMTPEEVKRSGMTKVQLIILIGEMEIASPLFDFKIVNGLVKYPIRPVEIRDWDALTMEARMFVEDLQDLTAEEFAELKMDEKLINLERDYAGRLQSTENQLKAKVDKAEFTAQLASKANKNDVRTIKGTYTTVADLTSAKPSGDTGNYVVSANGHIYTWNGTVWQDTGILYQAVGIADGSVTETKTSFLRRLPGINLFDKTKITLGKEVYGDGSIRNQATSSAITEYINVQGMENIYLSGLPVYTTSEDTGNRYSYFYDTNKQPIGSSILISASANEASIPVPENAVYYVLSIYQRKVSSEAVSLDTIQIGKTVYKMSPDVDLSPMVKDSYVTNRDITVEDTIGKNLFDKTKITLGKEVYGDGSIRNETTGSAITEYINVQGMENIYLSGLPVYTTSEDTGNRYSYFYDTNKQPIGSSVLISASTNEASIPVPENAVYYVLSIYQRKTSGEIIDPDTIQIENSRVKTTYEPFSIKSKISQIKGMEIKYPTPQQNVGHNSISKLEGLIWNVLGDSITDNAHSAATKKYHAVIQDEVNVTINNYGIAGTEISTGGTSPNPMVTRYTGMNKSAGLITVFGGINDYLHNVELGTFDSRDNATFYGALHNLCSGLYKNFPNATYVFFTPLQTNGSYGNGRNPNTKGYTVADIVQAIKIVCAFYSIKVVDLNAMAGITPYVPEMKTKYMPDGLHPNNAGHSVLATRILPELESVLYNQTVR